MLYAAKKLVYLEGLCIRLGRRRYFLTPPQLHASTLASSLDLLPQLFRPPSEIGFQLCCSDKLSVAAAAQLRVAVKNGDVDYSVLLKVDRGSDTSTGSSTLFGVYNSFTQATVDVTSGAGSHNFLH